MDEDEAGVTLVELLIVLLILGIVVTAIFGAMTVLTATEQRAQNRVKSQEAIRLALAEMSRDLRSSALIDTPASINPSSDLAAQWRIGLTTDENEHIQWRLDRTAKKLVRERDTDPSTATTAWVETTHFDNIRNGEDGTTFIRYYGSGNQRLEQSSATLTDLAACTLRLRLTIKAAAGDANTIYTASSDVGLRNRGSRGVSEC